MSASSEENFNVEDVFCISVGSEATRHGTDWRLPTKQVGKGAYGTVYEVCKKKTAGCNYVMKIIPFTNVFRTSFYREVNLQKEAAALEVAPPVSDWWECEDLELGVIIMPALEKTLLDILLDETIEEKTKDAYIKDAKIILQTLNDNNIHHGDAHVENFMIDNTGQLKIIDFGGSFKFPSTPVYIYCKYGGIERKEEFFDKDSERLTEDRSDIEDCVGT